MPAKLSATFEFITVFGVSIATTALLFAGLAGAVAPHLEGTSSSAVPQVVHLPTIQVTASRAALADEHTKAALQVREQRG
jgi:hypothetical protein